MPAGRKPTPPEIKRRKGNPGKRKIPDEQTVIQDEVIDKLAAPSWLKDRAAQRIYRQITQQMSHKLLRDTDTFALGRYASYLRDWITATQELGRAPSKRVYKTSTGFFRPSPWFMQQQRLEDTLIKLEDRLGLSPASRQTIISKMASGPSQQSLFPAPSNSNQPAPSKPRLVGGMSRSA